MSLFRRNNNQSIEFDLVGLDAGDFDEISKIITEHGGKVNQCDTQPVKFSRRFKHIVGAFPVFILYSIDFIKECVRENTIVDIIPFRIGDPTVYDECIVTHFLYGQHRCCEKNSVNAPANPQPEVEEAVDDMMECDAEDNWCLMVSSDEEQIVDGRLDRSNGSASVSSQHEKMKTSENIQPTAGPSGQNEKHTAHSNRSLLPSSDDDESETSRRENRPKKTTKKKGRGPRFSLSEDQQIVNYLVSKRLIGSTESGLGVWKQMLKDGICPRRSENSLYRHFRKFILPNIGNFKLTDSQLKKFRDIL